MVNLLNTFRLNSPSRSIDLSLPATKEKQTDSKHKSQKTAKANPVDPINPPAAKNPSLPGVEGAQSPPRATPARGTPEEETAGSNAKFPEEKAPEDKDKVGRARLQNTYTIIKITLNNIELWQMIRPGTCNSHARILDYLPPPSITPCNPTTTPRKTPSSPGRAERMAASPATKP
ncbi:MAG: hypothetical protein WBN94_05450 [Methanothrix sp.]